MEKATNKTAQPAAPAEKPQKQKTWNPRPEYLKSVTLKAAIRENSYVERDVVEKHWNEANKPAKAEDSATETEN